MILMHVENADSKDITEFERACSFAGQMKEGFFKSNVELARDLGLSKGYVSKLISAASIMEVPEVKAVLANRLDVSCKSAYSLSVLLQANKYKKVVVSKLQKIQSDLDSGKKIATSKIFKMLLGDNPESKVKNLIEHNNKVVVHAKSLASGKTVLTFEPQIKNVSKELVKEKLTEMIDAMH